MASHVISLISLFHESNIPVNVKTLITKVNQSDIINIGKILKNQPINYWSLIEFNPINRGKLNESKFSLSDDKFDAISEQARQRFPNIDIRIRKFKREPQKYCFIGSEGKVYTYIPDKGDVEIGNLENESLQNILKKIS